MEATRAPRTNRILPALVAVGALVSLGACAGPEPAPQASEVTAPQAGGTLVIAATADITGVNELVAGSGSFTQSVVDLLFLKLFEEQPDFDRGPPTFEPQLADRWSWSEDGTVLTIELRRDVRWSDGQTVTAADVEWTWRAQTDPAVAWPLANRKDNIVAIEAVEPYEVRVTFADSNPLRLADLNEGVILPRAVWSELPFADWHHHADWFVDHLVTNGPFRLGSWDRQQQIVLQRNPEFHVPQRPLLDRVVFRIVPDKTSQLGHLLTGEVQFVEQVPAADADRIAASADLRLLSYWARQYNFICWNTARQPFDSADIRRALTMAIDRQALVDALWSGHAKVAVSPILSSVWAHDTALSPLPYDPPAARRLLAAAGWTDSDGDGLLDRQGHDFVFDLITNSSSAVRVDAAVMIQEQLRRVGIRVDIQRLEFNAVGDRVAAHDFDAMLGGWTIDTSLDLDYAFHSDSIEDGYNFGSFRDAEVDTLLDQVGRQTRPEEIRHLLVEVQRRLHQQQPYTFLWEPQRLTATVVELQNAQPNALDPFYHLADWWLEPPD